MEWLCALKLKFYVFEGGGLLSESFSVFVAGDRKESLSSSLAPFFSLPLFPFLLRFFPAFSFHHLRDNFLRSFSLFFSFSGKILLLEEHKKEEEEEDAPGDVFSFSLIFFCVEALKANPASEDASSAPTSL